MCASTDSADRPISPPGVFARRNYAHDYVKRLVTEGLPLACFAGRFEITDGCCRFVTNGPLPIAYVALVLYRGSGELRNVALRKLIENLEHAADRPVRFLNGQPEICTRLTITEASGVYLLIDGALARQALVALRAVPVPQPPIEISERHAHTTSSTGSSAVLVTGAPPPS